MTQLSDISNHPKKEFTLSQIAEALVVGKSVIGDWIKKNKLKARKEPHPNYIRGYTWRIKGKDVMDYLVKAGEEARAEYQKELLNQ